MSTEQHDADAYGQEPARISHHQHEATDARFTVFQALAAAGVPPSTDEGLRANPVTRKIQR
ncbi:MULTISPECIES: hypothetical protein [unclassified Streptomyces]|uniref:hypothetical protein n=1 Tax=unclassified Streptomyces TaxID=2593676 RepID=UPI0033B1CD6A